MKYSHFHYVTSVTYVSKDLNTYFMNVIVLNAYGRI